MRLSRSLLPLLLAAACARPAAPRSTTTIATAPVEAPVGASVVASETPVAAPVEHDPAVAAVEAEPEPLDPHARNAPRTVDATNGLPDDLVDELPLWESVRAPDDEYLTLATRLYADGRFFMYSPRCGIVVNGKPNRDDASLAWRAKAEISATAVAEIERLIRAHIKSGVLDPPAKAPRPDLRPEQVSLTKRAWIDGAEYVLISNGDNEEKVQPWTKIDYELRKGRIAGTYQDDGC